jgi:hypothetical protein
MVRDDDLRASYRTATDTDVAATHRSECGCRRLRAADHLAAYRLRAVAATATACRQRGHRDRANHVQIVVHDPSPFRTPCFLSASGPDAVRTAISAVELLGYLLSISATHPAEAVQPDGSALAPMSAAGSGYQAPTEVAPFTVVPGNTWPEPA